MPLGRLTRLEETEGTVEAVFVLVAQHWFILVHYLLVCAQDHKKEPHIPLLHLTRVPLGRCGLVDIASNAGSDGGPGRQAARHRQTDTQREERVYKAPGVADHTRKGKAIRAGVVRIV